MIHIRPARVEDLDTLQAIESRSFSTDKLSRRSFSKAVRVDNHVLLVAIGDDNRPVGYALLHLRKGGHRARLYSIAVDEACRGAGIGRDLLAASEAEAATRKLDCIRLEVRRDDARTQAFYQRNGYAARKIVPRFYEDGADAVQMEKVLPVSEGAVSAQRQPGFVLVVGRNQDRKPLEDTAQALNVRLITAADYLARPEIAAGARQVVNLCPVEDYLSQGYYVSLLAEARAQRAMPNIDTVTGLAWKKLYKDFLGELTALANGRMPKEVAEAASDGRLTVEVYFGQAEAEWARRMAARAYRLFPSPILEVMMVRHKSGWAVDYIWPLSIASVTTRDMPRFLACLTEYCQSRRNPAQRRKRTSFDLAILANPKEAFPPSTEQAIRHFIRAADRQNIQAEVIGPKELDRLSSFDALFIRETTNIDNHTFTFARLAEASGMPVIDDPVSILRCSNKVYLREAMARARIATPKTVMITKASLKDAADSLVFPTVLKIPDGSFSRGVIKVKNVEEFRERAAEMLEDSFIILAQEYLPTPFDWRIGILDGKPLFACKYHMARGHWQIYHHTKKGKTESGGFETLLIEEVPQRIVRTAIRASLQMGRGLYGVDLKEIGGTPYVIEVNDNPNIDAGVEDKRSGDDIYNSIISLFRERILASKGLARPADAAPAGTAISRRARTEKGAPKRPFHDQQ